MNMTVEKCLKICKNKGFDFAGLQWQIECYCGNVPTNQFQWAWPGRCDDRCAGDSNQICGGSMAMSLYKTPEQDPKGLCIYDHPAKRVLDGKSVTGLHDLTMEKCSAYCSDYKYFGLQGGDECHCGDYDDNFLPSSQLECNIPCTGDDKICGGSWRMNVFLNEGSELTTNLPSFTTADLIEVLTTESTWNLDTTLNLDTTMIPLTTAVSTAAGWSLLSHFQISEENNFEIYEEDVEFGSDKDMFVLGDQDDDGRHEYFTYFSSETYQDLGYATPSEFDNSLATTMMPWPYDTTDVTWQSYTEQNEQERRFRRSHRNSYTTAEMETTDRPTGQPNVDGLLCSSYYCDASKWISRDSPAGTGDHERFE